jgi:hypothetical protein
VPTRAAARRAWTRQERTRHCPLRVSQTDKVDGSSGDTNEHIPARRTLDVLKFRRFLILQRHLIADRLPRAVKAWGTVDLEQQHRSAGASPDFMGLDLLSVAEVLIIPDSSVHSRASAAAGKGLPCPSKAYGSQGSASVTNAAQIT